MATCCDMLSKRYHHLCISPNLLAPQPIMLYHPGKIASFSRLTLERGIAAVVVGFPATHLLTARARICISASHTRKDLDCALKVLEEVADDCLLRYNGPGHKVKKLT